MVSKEIDGLKRPFIILLTFCLVLSTIQVPNEPAHIPSQSLSSHVTTPVTIPGAIWAHTYGGDYDDTFRSIAECADDGFIITGRTETDDSDDDKLWLQRANSNGALFWSYHYVFASPLHPVHFPQSGGSSVIECSNGGFAVGGWVSGRDFLLIRTDASGTLLWNYTYGGPDDDYLNEVIECADGGFALAGRTGSFGTSEGDSVWLLRTDASGIQLWNRTYGNPYHSSGNGIVECSDGGFAIVGFSNNADYSNQDVLLIRTDALGGLLWNHTYNERDEDEGNDIVECTGGGFALAGETETDDPYVRDLWVARVDSTGTLLWSQIYSSPSPHSTAALSIIESPLGGFAFAGIYQGESGEDTKVLFVRTDAAGILLHYGTLGTMGNVLGYSLVNCRSGGFAIAGSIETFGQDQWDGLLLRVLDPVSQLVITVIVMVVVVVAVILLIWVILRRRHRNK